MSTDIAAPAHPHPVLPKAERVDFAISLLLARQGLGPEQIHGLIVKYQAKRREIEARYPVADGALPLGEQMAANERTLAAAVRERTIRQFVTE